MLVCLQAGGQVLVGISNEAPPPEALMHPCGQAPPPEALTHP